MSAGPMSSPFAAPLLWSATLAGLLLVAGCVMLSPLQGQVHADHIVPVLVSLLHWSPYYWGADRFGMLLPLLAGGIADPFWNLLTQTVMSAWLGLLAPFCLAWFLFGGRYAFAVGALVSGAYLAFFPPFLLYEYLGLGQCYAPALGLGCAGVCVFEAGRPGTRGRLIAMLLGTLLLGLGFWLTPSLLLTLLPLVVLRDLLGVREGSALRSTLPWLPAGTLPLLGVLLLCFAASYTASRLHPFHVGYDLLPFAQWGAGISAVFHSLVQKKVGPPLLPLGFLAGALCGLLLLWRRGHAGALRRAGGALLCAAGAVLCELLVMGTNTHVAMNAFDGRYLLPSRNVYYVLCAFLFVSGLCTLRPGRLERPLIVIVGLLLLMLAPLRFGLPSAEAARTALRTALPARAATLQALGCTHVVGDYWQVWPTVFAVNWLRHEAGQTAPVWGLSDRAVNTAPAWTAVPPEQTRICGFPEDAALRDQLSFAGYVKPRCQEAQGITVCETDIASVFHSQMLQRLAADLLPELPGAETVALPLEFLDGRRMVLFAFRDGTFYRYALYDAAGNQLQAFVDADNSGHFLPEAQSPPLQLEAYGFARP